ncbi:GltI [Acrasis kona]|uniref:GltI n=1 Tax=Acrasis kona TaxID=1008807 RepID=A0AAW2YKP5_9EUKA
MVQPSASFASIAARKEVSKPDSQVKLVNRTRKDSLTRLNENRWNGIVYYEAGVSSFHQPEEEYMYST